MIVKQRFEYLKKKFKNKKIIIYGAGIYFKNLGCDFSQLNVVGIVDKKFLEVESGEKFYNFKKIPYKLFNHNDADFILVVLKNPKGAIEELKEFVPKNKIISFENPSILDKINIFQKEDNNNIIVLIKENGERKLNPKIKKLSVRFDGKNNYIEIHEPFFIHEKLFIQCDSNSKLIVGRNNNWKKLNILLGNSNEVIIGEDTTIARAEFVLIGSKNTKINIGKDCMISYNVVIRIEDAHTIYDNVTKKIVNIPEDVRIGNHVWVAPNSTIFKGSNIPSNCVISTFSLVNKHFDEENCIIAGIPAKVVKKGINWDRRRAFDYIESQI